MSWGDGGAIASVSCTREQKQAWESAVDELGWRSFSAMARYALDLFVANTRRVSAGVVSHTTEEHHVSQHGEDYRCDSCGTIKGHLSTSWSTITTLNPASGEVAGIYHFCLDCRSRKVIR